MSSYPEAQPRKDYYEVVDIYTLGSKKIAELSNGKLVFLTPEEYQQARRGIFQHYASENHPKEGYTLDQIIDSAAGVQGRETYSESVSYKHGKAESFHAENDFPLDITHDDIDYYLLERLEDGSEEIGVYHTDITDAPDPVLHLYLGEAQDKASESFESEPSYSLSAPLSQGVRPMSSKKMMMNGLAIGVAALIGFNFDRIVSMLRKGNGEDEQAAESMQSAANQGFMESWTGGNSGNPADDPRMEAKTMQGAVEDEPQVKYNYQPFAGPSQVFHDEQTRQKNFFIY